MRMRLFLIGTVIGTITAIAVTPGPPMVAFLGRGPG